MKRESRSDVSQSVRIDSQTMIRGGRERTFTVVSATAAQRPKAALVLVLHGSNQTGAKVRVASGATFDALVNDHDAVVVYPDAYKGLWNDARSSMKSPARREQVDDVDFLVAVVDEVRRVNGPLPVYVVGYSNGGQMAIRLVHERPNWLAGAVLIGANQPTADIFAPDHDDNQALPITLIHGTRDPIVPYAGGMASLFGFRPRGTGLSAPDTAAYYAARNHIHTEPSHEDLAHHPKSGKTSVTVHRWRQADHPSVTLYTVAGGGHTIPNPRRRALPLLGRTTHHLDASPAVGQLIDEARLVPPSHP